ncbi:DUF664 domain-containing protein [Saccharopolyspora spinosporotrichia]|nr:hypothetical protein N599_12290 [Saccharopolyspora erythraea D]
MPSGWVPLGLLKHLAHVERRWLQWGFAAEQVDRPWADHEPGSDDRWLLEPDDTLDSVREFFLAQCERSRAIAAGARLEDRSAVGGRFGPGDEPPTLAWILFHLLQEYARHVGHLDIARELGDGLTGE